MPHVDEVSADELRAWSLPAPGADKKSRGDVLVVGGSRRTPGGIMLAGEAALRVGAGRLRVFVPGSIDAQVGTVLPEAGIHPLPDQASDPFGDAQSAMIAASDAVLVGPGFDDADETRDTVLAVAAAGPRLLVLDAYALGILPRVDRARLPEQLILTPNREELAILLDSDADEVGEDLVAAAGEAARRYQAVVSCYEITADAEGRVARISGGGPGLATSGSGDALAGAVTGFAARGTGPMRAAVWGAWVHARAGDRLTERLGLGFLARELVAELPLALREVAQ